MDAFALAEHAERYIPGDPLLARLWPKISRTLSIRSDPAHGGLPAESRPPEVDELNFLPRVNVPVLMINGRYDHVFPVELSQKPFFERVGTKPADKTHLVLGGGHSSPRNELIQAVLSGLDRYLGPVERR